jgi:hypothetical protein
MAAQINVPPSQQPAIKELAKLSSEAYSTLNQYLAQGAPLVEPNILLEQTSKTTAPHTKLGGQIAAAIIGLRGFVDSADMSVADVVAGVATDAHAKNYVDDQLAEVLKQRLAELLETHSVMVSAKAYALMFSSDAIFNDVRIVSDVRPIFTGDQMMFSGSLIVHLLAVQVAEGKDLYVSMTTADLRKLQKTVERALEKDKRIRDTLTGGPLEPLKVSVSSDSK